MPAPNRSVRAQSPPIDRAATSITHTRSPKSPSVDRRTSDVRPGPSVQTRWTASVGRRVRRVGRGRDERERRRREARRRDVDRLLEVRTLERVGLVEHREHLERAVAQQPLERDLDARDVLLDDHRAVPEAGDPGPGGVELLRGVAADHALAAREPGGLDDAREPDRRPRRCRTAAGAPRRRRAGGASRPCRGSRPPHPAGCGGSRAGRRPRRRPRRPGRRPRPPRRPRGGDPARRSVRARPARPRAGRRPCGRRRPAPGRHRHRPRARRRAHRAAATKSGAR